MPPRGGPGAECAPAARGRPSGDGGGGAAGVRGVHCTHESVGDPAGRPSALDGIAPGRQHDRVPSAPHTPDEGIRIRAATPDDAPALVELRALMLTEMGSDPGPDDSPWRTAARAWFAERLAAGTVLAVVAEHPVDSVVASAVGAVERQAPSPSSPDGTHARVSTVVTRPAHRGRGLARRCTVALLDRLRAETTAGVVDLNATAPAEAIYRGLGFREPRFVALQARVR